MSKEIRSTFTVAAIGKDGNEWIIHLPVDTFIAAENIIEQLGLVVNPAGWGKLISEFNVELPVDSQDVGLLKYGYLPGDHVRICGSCFVEFCGDAKAARCRSCALAVIAEDGQ